MDTPRNNEISDRDLFNFLQAEVQSLHLKEVEGNLRHPARLKFVRELIGGLDEYNRSRNLVRPHTYYQNLQDVIMGHPTKLAEMMSLCKYGKLEEFGKMMSFAHVEAMQRSQPQSEGKKLDPRDIQAIQKALGYSASKVVREGDVGIHSVDARTRAQREGSRPLSVPRERGSGRQRVRHAPL